MISTIILNTLLACQANKSQEPALVQPPDSPDTPENPKAEQKPTRHDPGYENKPNASERRTGAVTTSMLAEVQSEQDTCISVCLNHSAPPPGSRTKVESCDLELNPNWEELLADFLLSQEDTEVGRLNCNVQFSYVRRGRAPKGGHPTLIESNDLGGFFARGMQEEFLSVFAFAEIHEFLSIINAPDELLQKVRSAMEDEKRHTRLLGRLCERYNHPLPPLEAPTRVQKDAFEWALHNALTGCIGETWAAVLEAHRAQNSNTHNTTFSRIARDEAKHAQLSWDIYEYLNHVLTEQQQQVIQEQMLEKLKLLPKAAIMPRNNQIGEPDEPTRRKLWTVFAEQINALITPAA